MSNQSNQMAISAIMIALYNFDAEDDPEISLKKGDRVEMLDMDPALNGWAYARKKTDGSEGYVPISYLGTSNTRSHKHSKTAHGNQTSRSSSPNPSKNSRYDDKNASYNRQNYSRNQNYLQNQNQNQSNQNNDNNNNQSNNNNNNTQNNNLNQKQNNNNTNNEPAETKQIICSFHRDFIPQMDDLYKYFGEFGKITNKLEIEYDGKKVPLAKIKFISSACVEKVCGKGNRQQIPSGAQNGTIHIRVYRSMQDYINNTQRSNRGHAPYNKHKNSRRGGF